VPQQKGLQTDVHLWICEQRRGRRNRFKICRIILWKLRSFQLCRLQSLMAETIKIGTRGSKLALCQANWVKSSLENVFPPLSIDIVIIKTTGDEILDVPLAEVGGKGLFVKEIEEALFNGQIDIAVHSMKDMPSVIPQGLCIGSIPERETPQDVMIARDGHRFLELKSGARIGTGSLRRAAQLRHRRSVIEIMPIRGNIDTRLRKLDTENIDAIVLAAAGVKRLELTHRITEYLDEDIMLPAVGQGTLCLEIREGDKDTREIVNTLDHPETRAVITGERAFLIRLEGSCQVPIAGYGKRVGSQFSLRGRVADIDGQTVIEDTLTGDMAESEHIGTALAERLLSMGAKDILEKLTAENS
jgi:hydroxymethylbilane synthase